MTIPQGLEGSNNTGIFPIPVVLMEDKTAQADQAAYYGAWQQYPFQGVPAELGKNNAIRILNQDPYRKRAVIVVAGISSTDAQSFANAGAVTTPAAGAVITSVNLPAGGPYVVTWLVGLTQSAAGSDADNMQLELGGTPLLVATVRGVVGTYPQLQYTTPVIPPGGETLSVNAIAAGSATAQYLATISAQAEAPSVADGYVMVGTTAQNVTGTGGILPVGTTIVVENQQALHLSGDGQTPLIVSVLTEKYRLPEG